MPLMIEETFKVMRGGEYVDVSKIPNWYGHTNEVLTNSLQGVDMITLIGQLVIGVSFIGTIVLLTIIVVDMIKSK